MTHGEHSPPALAEWLMRRVLKSQTSHHGVIGDLREEYHERLSAHVHLLCDMWYWRQAVLVFLRFRREHRKNTEYRGKREFTGTILQDIKYATRSLHRTPGFTAVVVLTLALGVGSTTAIFSLVNGMLLQPLPFHDSHRVVAVWPDNWYSKGLFELFENQASSYESLAAWAPRVHTVIDDQDGASRLVGPRVTARFFEVLEPAPVLGRTFAEEEDRAGSDDVVVISHGLWQRRFGGDREVLGQRIRLRGMDRTVIGVMRPGFDFLQPDAEVAVPQLMDRTAPGYGSGELKVIGRLKSGVTVQQAQAELLAFNASLHEEFTLPEDWGVDARVVRLRDVLAGEVGSTLLLLFGAVGLILLIATANVVNLLFARSLSRRREIAVRLALGASRVRLMRQLVTETTVLGLLGSLPGIAVAVVGLRFALALIPTGAGSPMDLSRLAGVGIDGVGLGFCVLLAIGTGWVAGLTPAIQSARTDLRHGLEGSRGGTETGNRLRLRSLIVTAEVALAVLLLAGSGLLVKSFWHLTRVDPGFRPEGLLAFTISPEAGRVGSAAEFQIYYDLMQERLEAIPGVEEASSIWYVPFAPDGGITRFRDPDNPPPEGTQSPLGRWRPVHPDLFRTAGIPLIEGRFFDGTDTENGQQVGVLSRAAASTLFPAGDAVGKSASVGIEGADNRFTVIGIAGDVKSLGLDQESPATVYRPYSQVGPTIERFGFRSRSVMLRTTGDPYAIAPQVRQAVRLLDSNALIGDMESMTDAISDSFAKPRLIMLLISLFTGTALILAAIGVYGVMAYAVRERTKEISIRVAIGASRRHVLGGILLNGMRMAAAGTILGIGLSVLVLKVLESFLFEVAALDPFVLGAAATLSMAIALLASFIPARRAGLVDPVDALSAE